MSTARTLSDSAASYRWAAPGDVNAFFALLLDNVAGLFLVVAILTGVFGFPADFVIGAMIPGTAIGVFAGDAAFFAMAFWLARRSGSREVTAMPLGLDTPSVFGITYFVLGPAYRSGLTAGLSEIEAATQAWHIGIFCMVAAGFFKLLCAPAADWVRRVVPRAGLLGSLSAIALAIISFLPLLDVLAIPPVGMVVLFVILVSLLGHVPLPLKLPGAVVAFALGLAIYAVMRVYDLTPPPPTGLGQSTAAASGRWLDALNFQWLGIWWLALGYLPIALPFALTTVIGGIDCTESAAAVGDDYPTGGVIAVEAVATLIGGLFGGVVQTTPYIGHPAYKTMGGRSAYTLATALSMLVLGLTGLFTIFYAWIPAATLYPLLVFVGMEITAQSFRATPPRHYPAVAFACAPALAFLALNFADQILVDPAVAASLAPELRAKLETATLLSHGLILTSLLWASALALAIDRKLAAAAGCLMACCVLTLFGLIHSPFPSNQLFLPIPQDVWPWIGASLKLPADYTRLTWSFASGYALTAALLYGWSLFVRNKLGDAGGGTHSGGPEDPAIAV